MNIINEVALRVKDYAKKHKIHNTDFERIIYIVDTDGTFIPEDKVEFDSCCQKTHYELECIKTANVNRTLLRNQVTVKSSAPSKNNQALQGITIPAGPYSFVFEFEIFVCIPDHIVTAK